MSLRLDPTQEFSEDVLKLVSPFERKRYQELHEQYLSSSERRKERPQQIQAPMEININPAPVPAPAPAPAPAAEAAPPVAPPRAPEAQIIELATPGVQRRSNALSLRHKPLQLASYSGDRTMIVAGYKDMSLCNMITRQAIERAYAAIPLLDASHAQVIQARLTAAGLTNRNASHISQKDITFKKAASIALQAERWVYQAQAAAAKSMVSENKRCLHALAGKRRRTTEEKEATYAKKVAKGVKGYTGVRGNRKERAIKKAQKKLDKLQAEE